MFPTVVRTLSPGIVEGILVLKVTTLWLYKYLDAVPWIVCKLACFSYCIKENGGE